MRYLVSLMIAATLLLAPEAKASLICSTLFQAKPNTSDEGLRHIMDLLFFTTFSEFGPKTLEVQTFTVPNRYFELIWNHAEFRAFHSTRGTTLPRTATYKEMYQYISQYVSFTLTKYQSEEFLSKKRNSALADGLRRHGVSIQSETQAREALVKLSRQNLEHHMEKIKPSLPNVDADIVSLADSLELSMVHNSRLILSVPKFPVLAPGEIEKMGLARFGASTHDFNRLLGSEKHVYFWPVFSFKGSDVSHSSEYGNGGIIVDRNYADNHGWVSAFVMYPGNLLNALEHANPEVANTLAKDLTVETLGVPPAQSVAIAQRELYRYDFTPQDYEFLVKSALKVSLQTLKNEDPELYADALKDLRKTGRSLTRAIEWITADFLDIPSAEAKVPAGVPTSRLRPI